tara:strand:- start:513 stop:1319 length:807 start_codon:yes stop_codon:yes gene_type:complete
MLHTKQKTLAIVCNRSNKLPDGRYKIPMGALASESVVGASVKSVVYRNLFYNVVADGLLKNNVFYLALDAVQMQVVIPEGFYKISILLPLVISGIQNLLNTFASPATISMVYSSLTGKVSCTYTAGGSPVVFSLPGGDFVDSVNLLLGNIKNLTFSTGVEQIFDSVIDLSGEDSCGLVIEEIGKGSGLSNSNTSSFGSTSGLLTNLNFEGSTFGSLKSYINPNILETMLFYSSPVNLSALTIYLQTASGIILNLQSSDMHIEILLHLL